MMWLDRKKQRGGEVLIKNGTHDIAVLPVPQ
jgi:hypothetical protein